MHLSLCLVIFSVFLIDFGFSASPGDVSAILNKITENYDKRVRPDYGEKPVQVNVTMYILRGYEISERNMNWKIQFYFRQAWQDRRLAFNFPGISNITVGPEMAKNFWQPDTFFPASTSTKLKTDENVFFRIKSDGTILTSAMVTTDSFCPMDLTYYPHDRQVCTLDAESYGYTTRDISYQWKDDPQAVGFDPAIRFEDLKVVKTLQRNRDITLSSGQYSGVALEVTMARNTGYFCRQFYLPAIIFAILTWLTFWIPDPSKIFRGLTLLTSFLSFWILAYRASNCVPRLEYTTRLEQYTTTCLILSLLTVLEYVLVIALSKRFEGKTKTSEEKNDINKEIIDPESGKANSKVVSYVRRSVKYVLNIQQHRGAPVKIDFISKIIYPLLFFVFNVWYWASFPSTE